MIDAYLFKKHLEDDEHVTAIVHKHWLVGIRFLALPVVSFLLSWIVLGMTHTRVGLVISALWSMSSLVWLMRNFFDYYLDTWIITDHGVIDLEWLGWFHRQSSRILYSDMEGISTEIHGVTGTILRYGTVTIEKISTGSAVTISHVPRPRSVESAILKNMEAYLHTKNLKNAKHIEELLSKFVADHIHEDAVSGTKEKKEVASAKPATPARPTKTTFTSSKIGTIKF